MEFLAVFLLIAYLVPFTVAAAREHPRLPWILALDLALGWTLVGWWLALAWACSIPEGRVSSRIPWLHPRPPSTRIRRQQRFELLPGGAIEGRAPGAQRRRAPSGHLRVAARAGEGSARER